MAICSAAPSPSSAFAFACKSHPSLFRACPSSQSSPCSHQFSVASQLCPVLIQRRGIHCSPVRISAFHTCPDTCSPPSTLYDVLQVPQTASHTEIKAAYRRLARLYHPDAGGATAAEKDDDKEARTQLFLQIHSAYATLLDAQARARYDLQLSIHAWQGRAARVNSPLSADTSPAFSPYRVGRNWETDQCWC